MLFSFPSQRPLQGDWSFGAQQKTRGTFCCVLIIMLARLSFTCFSFAAVRESLLVRQVYLARTILTRAFATKKEQQVKFKRPPTAYQLFASANRDHLAQLHPDKPKQEITKALYDRWREMSEDEKSPFKQEHEEKMGLYKAPLEKLPKKPPGVFGLFVKENYSRIASGLSPGFTAPDVMRELSGEWNSMSDEDKEQLKQKHDSLVEEYNKQIMTFEQGLTPEERDFLLQKRGVEMRTLAKKKRKLLTVGMPKMPPGPFIRFMKKSFREVENESPVERMKILGQRWRELSDEEKEVYNEEYRGAREQHIKDLAEWKEKHPDAV